MLSSCGNSFHDDGSQDEFYLMTRENKVVAKKLNYSDMDTSNSIANVSKVNYIHLRINDFEKPSHNQSDNDDESKLIYIYIFF